MLPRKTTDYYCRYPVVEEDSAYHYENCNWQYADSVRTYWVKYKEDYMPSGDFQLGEDGSYRQVWIPKVGTLVEENLDYIGLQDYVVPAFFSIITMVLIFGLVVIRDSKKGEKEKQRDSILDFMKKD